MMTDFSTLAKEYQDGLPQEYLDQYGNSEPSMPRSSSFEAYESLYLKMSQQVRGKLTNIKQRKRKNVGKFDAKLVAGGAVEESESEVDDQGATSNELYWEEDTDSTCSDSEDLIAFRNDLEFLDITKSAPIDIIQPLPVSTKLSVPSPQSDVAETIHDLDEQFQKELSKASILADFHERYILASLERKRLGLQTTQHDSRRLWQETIDANPLVALENISRSLLSVERQTPEPHQTSSGSIRELVEGEEGITLSQRSQEYHGFIPNISPRLDIDDDFLERASKFSKSI